MQKPNIVLKVFVVSYEYQFTCAVPKKLVSALSEIVCAVIEIGYSMD